MEKVVLLIVLVMSLFLVSLSFVLGQVAIQTVDIPPSIDENTMLNIYFDATTDLSTTINYSIYENGILVSNNNSFSNFFNYTSAGSYLFTLYASDGVTLYSENNTVEVLNIPLTIVLNNPNNGVVNSKNILINSTLSTYADACTYSINNSITGTLTNYNNNLFYKYITLNSDGAYSLIVNCSNIYDTISTSTSFTVDTTNIAVLSKSYTIGNNNVVTFNLTTNMPGICKYDSSDKSYDSMSLTFTSTNDVKHSTAINGLSDGSYMYYIKCRNVYDNITLTNTEGISFVVANKPVASISLSKSPPLKAGTYEVRLTTSKSVPIAPSLYYNFNTDASARYVTLTGSNTEWKGYIIISESTSGMIGTFHYSSNDGFGNIGNTISNGEIFLIDTIKPISSSSLQSVVQDDGTIRLKWYYDGEEVSRYNIYRSTNNNVDYVDYYDSVNSQQYVDRDVINGITYYYRIAAVDKAGNDGILSEIVSETSTKNYVVNTADNTITVQKSLDGALVPKIDQLVSELEKYVVDIDTQKSLLEETNDPNKLKIITLLKLNDKAKTAKVTLNAIITQVKDIKNQDIKSSELDVRLNKLRMDAIKAKSMVAEDIVVSEQSNYDQVTQESDVDDAISQIVNLNLSKTVLENYSISNKKLQDFITINTDIMIFKIQYMGKDDYDKYTLVKKIVSSSQDLKDIVIIENIPKNFETKASNIIFDIDSQQKPSIVKEDPVLQWSVDAFNKQTIYYMINNHVDISYAKNTRTIVLYKPTFKFTQTLNTDSGNTFNALTGFIELDVGDVGKISMMQWLVLIGVALIIGLSTYYVALDRKEKKRNVQRVKDHKIILPNKVSQNKIVAVTKPVALTQVNTIKFNLNKKLVDANTLINNFDYENSRIVYNQCMQAYNQTVFKDSTERSDVKNMLNHLYIKLTAYRLIYESRKNVHSRNYVKLRQDLKNINELYTKLYRSLEHVDEDNKVSERKFVDYVANSRRYLEGVAS